MQKVCDLHIHSKYSEGASKNIDIFKIALNSEKKGINIVGTGDCLHPSWLNELKNSLIEYSDGVYYLPKLPNVYFILQTEIELIWKYNSHLRRVHFLILFPNFEKLDECVKFLMKFGNLMREGRPKIYNSAESLIFGLKSIDNRIEIIPAHIFTPFFGIYGEKSFFKNMKEALGGGFSLIHAIETGLSADPFMVRSISELNRFTIISNSDCHCFNKLNYQNLVDSLRRNKNIKAKESTQEN